MASLWIITSESIGKRRRRKEVNYATSARRVSDINLETKWIIISWECHQSWFKWNASFWIWHIRNSVRVKCVWHWPSTSIIFHSETSRWWINESWIILLYDVVYFDLPQSPIVNSPLRLNTAIIFKLVNLFKIVNLIKISSWLLFPSKIN